MMKTRLFLFYALALSLPLGKAQSIRGATSTTSRQEEGDATEFQASGAAFTGDWSASPNTEVPARSPGAVDDEDDGTVRDLEMQASGAAFTGSWSAAAEEAEQVNAALPARSVALPGDAEEEDDKSHVTPEQTGDDETDNREETNPAKIAPFNTTGEQENDGAHQA